jgi:hypothetical protein
MPDPVTGIIAGGATLIGSSMQSSAAKSAARTAAGAQEAAAELGIEEQRRQFDEVRKLLEPYVTAGTTQLTQFAPFQEAGRAQIPVLEEFAAVGPEALRQQRELAGLAGPEAQRAAISRLEGSPEFQALTRQGEEALLQRASATGGLRGGNIQAALAQFRPQMLQQQIETQLRRLGGFAGVGGAASERLLGTGVGSQELLARLGQASAAGTAAGATTLGSNVASALGQIGAAQAGAALAGGTSPVGQFLGAVPGMIGTYYGLTGTSPFGSFGAPAAATSGPMMASGGVLV